MTPSPARIAHKAAAPSHNRRPQPRALRRDRRRQPQRTATKDRHLPAPSAASRASRTTTSADPHDNEPSTPTMAVVMNNNLVADAFYVHRGPAGRNGLRQTVIPKMRSTCARIGMIGPTAS